MSEEDPWIQVAKHLPGFVAVFRVRIRIRWPSDFPVVFRIRIRIQVCEDIAERKIDLHNLKFQINNLHKICVADIAKFCYCLVCKFFMCSGELSAPH